MIANAIRHTPNGGRVHVGVRRTPAGGAEIAVEDECGGIPDDVLPRVFDVGYRGNKARPLSADDGGAGLGLAITRGILEAHNGTTTVDNTRAGCRFRLLLPAL